MKYFVLIMITFCFIIVTGCGFDTKTDMSNPETQDASRISFYQMKSCDETETLFIGKIKLDESRIVVFNIDPQTAKSKEMAVLHSSDILPNCIVLDAAGAHQYRDGEIINVSDVYAIINNDFFQEIAFENLIEKLAGETTNMMITKGSYAGDNCRINCNNQRDLGYLLCVLQWWNPTCGVIVASIWSNCYYNCPE